jgi:hypothetical protein
MPGVTLAEPLLTLRLISGAEWPVTLSDMLLALGVLLLLFEVIKAARPGAKYLTEHLLSLTVFAAAAAEFLLLPRFGTSTYFLLTVLGLVDFLSGVALRARRGKRPVAAAQPPARTYEKASEPRFDPAPGSSAPVAEAVPSDRSEPKMIRPEVTPAGTSPEVVSPGLQPGEGSPAPPR